jgi:hypothetical protein
MIRRILCAAGLALAVAAPAEARANITVDTTLPAFGVAYLQFTVTAAGYIDIWTTSRQGTAGTTPFDPFMYLFSGAGTAGPLVTFNDDGCNQVAFPLQCGPSASGANALFDELILGTGTYTLAVGSFPLNETEARTGFNNFDPSSGDFSIRIGSIPVFIGHPGGGEAIVDAAAVPEPGSLMLLGTGIAAAALVRRRRRR